MNRYVLGEKLKTAREKKGYSQQDVELAINIKRSRLSRIERGKIESVRLEEITNLINLYEINASWLIQNIGYTYLSRSEKEHELLESFNLLSDKNKKIILEILKHFSD